MTLLCHILYTNNLQFTDVAFYSTGFYLTGKETAIIFSALPVTGACDKKSIECISEETAGSDVFCISHPAFARRHPITGRRSTTQLSVVRIVCSLVRPMGFEPMTSGLKVHCSTC